MDRRRFHLTALTGALTCTTLGRIATAPDAAARPPIRPAFDVTSLGTPLTDVLVLGGVLAPGPDGRPALWVATGGKPSHLQAVDPRTGEVLANHALTHANDEGYAEGGYALAATANGSVYVGTYYDGRLYRRRPGTNSAVEDLGQAVAGNTYVFSLTVSGDKVYGGTFGGGLVFEFDPATDRFRSLGQLRAGQPYVRSLAAHAGLIYGGTQPDPHIVELDPTTGERRELPLPEGVPATGWTVHDLDVHDGLLFARIGKSIIDSTLYVRDLATGRWIGSLAHVSGLHTAPPDADGRYYVTVTDGKQGVLTGYEPRTDVTAALDLILPGRVTNNRGIGWVDLGDPEWPGRTLVQMLWRGSLLQHNPQTGRSRVLDSAVVGEPIGIWSIAAGKDDIFVGGYLNGGIGLVDPESGDTEFHRFAQTESIAETGSTVWLGTYPDARLYRWDRTLTWNNPEYSPGPVGSAVNPTLLADGKAATQMRATAVAVLPDTVAFGTQGGTQLTGTITLVDRSTQQVRVVPGPVTDQGVVALIAHHGVLYAGTSKWGAYSVPTPTTDTGHLVAFDPIREHVLWKVPLKPGQAAVTGLAFDAKGALWALANGTLYRRNRRNGHAMREITLAADQNAGTARGDLAFDKGSNTLWALVQQRQLWRIDARTGKKQLVLERPLSRMTVHVSGDVFVAADAELLRVRRG